MQASTAHNDDFASASSGETKNAEETMSEKAEEQQQLDDDDQEGDQEEDQREEVGQQQHSRQSSTASLDGTVSSSTSSRDIPGQHKVLDDMTFPSKLFQMLNDASGDPHFEDMASWGKDEQSGSFIIRNKRAFERTVLPKYFKMTKYKSFTRQLHNYGFRWIRRGTGTDTGGYRHKYFTRDGSNIEQIVIDFARASSARRRSTANNNNNNNKLVKKSSSCSSSSSSAVPVRSDKEKEGTADEISPYQHPGLLFQQHYNPNSDPQQQQHGLAPAAHQHNNLQHHPRLEELSSAHPDAQTQNDRPDRNIPHGLVSYYSKLVDGPTGFHQPYPNFDVSKQHAGLVAQNNIPHPGVSEPSSAQQVHRASLLLALNQMHGRSFLPVLFPPPTENSGTILPSQSIFQYQPGGRDQTQEIPQNFRVEEQQHQHQPDAPANMQLPAATLFAHRESQQQQQQQHDYSYPNDAILEPRTIEEMLENDRRSA